MRLSKEGILHESRAAALAEEGAARPQNVVALLEYWHQSLDVIDEDYTFGDLVSLLRHVQGIGDLSPMLCCDVVAFLADGDRPRDADDEQPIQYLRVCNVVELTKYEPNPSLQDERLDWMDDDEAIEHDRLNAGVTSLTGEKMPMKLVDATGDDPITGKPTRRRLRAPRMHGTWKPPYDLIRSFEGWGKWEEPYQGYFIEHPEIDPERYHGAFALDFTPLSALLHLPLRYDPTVQFWSGGTRGSGDLSFETDLRITFGEFLRAVFWEVGFHGSPSERDDVRQTLRERVAAIERDDPDES
jgi:hypothetical protein